MDGFATAISEITLVLFTTLAPAGAVGYALMMLPVLRGIVDDGQHRQLDRFSCLPLGIAMVGLIASATHLGNPSNALYVFAGVGRSPLSTEVFCAVIFLMLAGVYWLYSFAEAPRRRLQRALVAAIDLSLVAFLVSMAFAYDVDTILTWSLPLVPVALLLNGLVAGPLIALLGFAAAGYRGRGLGSGPVLIRVASGALVANVAAYMVLGVQLGGLGNELVTAAQLVPIYWPCLAAFVVLATAGLLVAHRASAGATPEEPERTGAEAMPEEPAAAGAESGGSAKAAAGAVAMPEGLAGSGASLVRSLALASALALAGIFVMRFTFYMSHLTIGLGA